MKQFLGALRSARKIEICILALVLALLLLACIDHTATDGGGASSEEARMQRILSAIDGAGRVRVMLSCDADGGYTGAVVAASGAEDIAVQLRIQRAVTTLTGLELEQIEIVKYG